MTDVAEALWHAVRDLDPALRALLPAVCWILALCSVLAGCARVLRHASGRQAPPSVAGTVLCFVIAVLLLHLPGLVNGLGATLFGAARPAAAALAYAPPPGAGWAQAGPAVRAVFAVVAWLGLFAVVRGLFVLRAAADGRPDATYGRAAAHVAGGVLCWHATGLVAAVEATLKIDLPFN